jgi:hypothetical protein
MLCRRASTDRQWVISWLVGQSSFALVKEYRSLRGEGPAAGSYRVEQHLEALRDRLGHVGFVTWKDTTGGQGRQAKPPPARMCRRGKAFQSGPGATRTRDLLLRRQALYPAELRTRRSGGENSPDRTVSATGLPTRETRTSRLVGGSSYDRGARI